MGERRARLGYGAQDRLAASLVLQALKSPSFRAVRLADLEGGQVDDFVLVWESVVWGNSVKWTGTDDTLSWGDLCGATEPLIAQLAEGWKTLRARWPNRTVRVYLRTNRPASTGTHGNQLVPGVSLERFLTLSWEARRRGEPSESPQIETAWSLIEQVSGLTSDEFRAFVLDCFVLTNVPVPHHDEPETLDAQVWAREFDRLRQVINDWVARNPQEDEIAGDELLRLIGAARQRTMLQRFPDPEIGYEENETAAQSLRIALTHHQSGYVALIGPAGAGKSTLVAKIIEEEPFGIAYFAYLPAGGADPRERGDALAFYRYVIGVMDNWESVREAHSVSDLAQAKEAFARHMARVLDRYQKTGCKTLILVDGLDHVAREQGLDRPLQRELPLPQELPEGFIILIGTQPQALHTLREAIRTQLEASERVIEVEPLPVEVARRCLTPERLGRELSEDEQVAVIESCGGNPMILTYLVRAFRAAPNVDAATLIAGFGTYAGDSDAYYAERFRPLLDEPDWKRLLALLCRVRGRTPLEWLQEWPEWERFEQLYRLHLAAFFREEEGRLSVLHNSLTSYLRRATCPPQSPNVAEKTERRFHLQLAERYPSGSCADELARERIYHLVVAGEHESVLATATMQWFREGATAFVPWEELMDLAWTCLRSAVALQDFGAMLRLVAVAKELEQRTVAMEISELCERFLELEQPERALQHVLDSSKLRLEPKPALEFCLDLAQYAQSRDDESLKRKARQIFDLAKPVRLLYAAGPVDVHGNEGLELVRTWASAAPYFVSLPHIIATMNGLVFENRRENPDERPTLLRAVLLNDALQTALEWGLPDTEVLASAIAETGETGWLFQARLRIIENEQLQGHDTAELLDVLRSVRNFEGVREDARLRVARCLWHAGQRDEARTLLASLQPPAPVPYPEQGWREGSRLGGVAVRIQLARMRAVMKLPPLQIPQPREADDEGAARVAVACNDIGTLWGQASNGQQFDDLDLQERFERLLTFHRRRVGHGNTGRYTHWAESARGEVYDFLLLVAEEMGEGGRALRAALLSVDAQPGQPVFTPHYRRKLALGLRRIGAITVTEALSLLRRSTSDANDEETSERTQACFSIAQGFHELGDQEGVRTWLATAGRASHGVGSHKDYQMISWMEWLDRSLPTEPEAVYSQEVALAARTLEVAGGDGGSDARSELVGLCFRRHPLVGVKLGLEMVERNLLDFASLLEAVIPSTARTGGDPQLLAATFARLYSLIETRSKKDVALSILKCARSDAQAQELACLCIEAVQVNVPSNRRRSKVRTIVDGLHERGLDAPELEAMLPPDTDEGTSSSSSWLYRMPDGTSRSPAAIARLLSDPAQEAEWNPHPDDNQYFAWNEAIDAVSIRSREHFDALQRQMLDTSKGQRDSNIITALSRAAMRMGDSARAQQLAERAFDNARDGGWIYWIDGAVKRNALQALVEVDPERWLSVAREEFIKDLLQRRMGANYLVQEIGEVFDMLDWSWPQNAGREIISTYFEGVTHEVAPPPAYESLLAQEEVWTPDEALCYLLVEQFANPVDSVASATRQTVSDFVCQGGRAPLRAFERLESGRTIEKERALVVLHTAVAKSKTLAAPFRDFVAREQGSASAAVQSVARRVCAVAGWPLAAMPSSELPPLYSLALPPEPRDYRALLHAGAQEIPGSSLGMTIDLYEGLLQLAADEADLPYVNLLTRARQIYAEVEREHSWARDGAAKLNRWQNAFPVLNYVRPQAFVSREAVMRVLGELIRAGRMSESFFDAYDYFAPIYDSHLEGAMPHERPSEVQGIQADEMRTRWPEWVNGLSRKDLLGHARTVGDRIVIAERSAFRVADWDWPEERRLVSLVAGAASRFRIVQPPNIPMSPGITRAVYEEHEEDESWTVVGNEARELSTPAAKWIALNPTLGNSLGWHLAADGLFRWTNANGAIMVESVWWRDGWTQLQPPHSFVSLGEGWLVLCTPEAFDAIVHHIGPARFLVSGKRSTQSKKHTQGIESSLVAEHPL